MSEDEFDDSTILRVGGGLHDRLRILDPEVEGETLDKVKDELEKFGLTTREAKIYLHLARFGPRKANKIAEELKTHRTETYHALTSLQNKKIVTATLERPISFIALPFEKAIEKIIKLEKERVTLAEKRSQHVFELWRSLPESIDKEIPIKQFQIFEGIDQAYGKMNEIQRNIESEVCVMASKMNLARLDQEGFLDRLKDMAKKSGITIRLLVDIESEKQVVETIKDGSARFLPANIQPVPHFVLADGKELLFFTSKEDAPRKKISAIWTNYDVFTKALYIMFIKLWEDSGPK